MKSNYLVCGACVFLAILAGCSTAPKSQADREMLEKEADLTIQKFKAADPDLQKFFGNSAGYAVLPSITKGGWFLGGAYGRGIMYEKGKPIGYVDTTHATIGLQWGGQAFSEIVFLETPEAVENLKYGKIKISGSVSAVAAKAGASKAVDYADHVAVFTLGEGGLMLEGAVGGQKFSFRPK
ncbi:MAG TPA: lipid-binding SYLF domain-containing protein [Candidatus Limnocylindrales bacterium]|nr:lipid-binding SYLF domain-containing protein [Candidatus Limnocylindrales bacterium]